MKKESTDEQVDRLLRSVVADSNAFSTEIDDIADSPQVWWAVQREIARGGDSTNVSSLFSWLKLCGVVASAAAVLLVGIYFVQFRQTINVADTAGPQRNDAEAIPLVSLPSSEPAAPVVLARTTAPKGKNLAVRAVRKERETNSLINAVAKRPIVTKSGEADETEIKSDFIALSYARNPDSGQIVRVKVPNSMKVTLGLVASVEKPGEMTDAEVLVGDDGLTRAIRFIR